MKVSTKEVEEEISEKSKLLYVNLENTDYIQILGEVHFNRKKFEKAM